MRHRQSKKTNVTKAYITQSNDSIYILHYKYSILQVTKQMEVRGC